MGASDWAGRRCLRLEEEFDISEDRALRITTLVRLLRGEGYEDAVGEYGSERHQKLQEQLIDELDKSLLGQSGNTIEERWNNLMDELDCQSRADNGVYVIPWSEHEADDWQSPGVTSSARELIPEIPEALNFSKRNRVTARGFS